MVLGGTLNLNTSKLRPWLAVGQDPLVSRAGAGAGVGSLAAAQGQLQGGRVSRANLKSCLIGRLQDRFQETIEVSCSSVQDDHPEGSETEMATETPAVPVVVRMRVPGETQPAENEGAPDLEEESPSNASSGGSPVDDAACISAGSFSYAELEEKLKQIPSGSTVAMPSARMFEVVETLVSGLRGMTQQHDLFTDLLRTVDYMKAFASQRKNSENQLRLRLEEAEASLSTARGDNEALRADLAEARSREESMDARCMRRRMRWLSEGGGEATPDGEREELEADYQKQVDDMFFFGYRCCMKKHALNGMSLQFLRDQRTIFEASGPYFAIVMSGCPLLIVCHPDGCAFPYFICPSKFLPNSAFASSYFAASVRIVGNPISVGMTASIPYARAKGVFPVGRRVWFDRPQDTGMNSGCSVRTEIPECDAIKLWTVVGYNGLRDSKAVDDVFPYEFGDIFVFDACICFSFHPFTEVIRATSRNFFWAGAAGRGPTMSMPHCAKGHGPKIGFNVSDGICGMGACL
ncbi:hypothetical protein CK203_081375 [Vitis vinifera]|uniref:Uncharacterized protein n=1 Tax=Vitis vinifera TaxID=29760 RepID=A0A438DG66_VITVI|nr:hypothetical protein CK203_081375 [Vitis vinifera]